MISSSYRNFRVEMPSRQVIHCSRCSSSPSSASFRTSRSQCRRGSRSPDQTCSIRVQARRRGGVAASSKNALGWQMQLASNLVLQMLAVLPPLSKILRGAENMHHKVNCPPECCQCWMGPVRELANRAGVQGGWKRCPWPRSKQLCWTSYPCNNGPGCIHAASPS